MMKQEEMMAWERKAATAREEAANWAAEGMESQYRGALRQASGYEAKAKKLRKQIEKNGE